MSDTQLQVKIISPTELYYEGPAVSVSAQNEVGPFDILAGHANFFSLLSPGMITVNPGTTTFSVPVTQGIVKVSHNKATFFVDIGAGYGASQ